MRYVSSCVYVSLGLGIVVAVPSVLVHSVEGHATGLHGSCSGGGGGGHMMYHGTLNRPVWSSSFPHGQFGASFSQIRSRPFIPGFQLTFSSCSATSIFRRTVASASQPSREDCMAIGCVSLEKVAIPELGVAPLVDPDTDLEDELPTPEDSMLLSYSSPEGVRFPGVHPTPPDITDLELEKALLSASVLPVMVTHIVDPEVVYLVAPSSYQEPPFPVLPDDDPGAASRISPLRVAADSPILDCTCHLNVVLLV